MKRAQLLRYTLVIFLISGLSIAATNNGKYFQISKQIEIFANLYKELNTYYVDDLDPAKLMRVGIDAMMESLDPYTVYISEAQIEEYRYMTEGKFNGIGAIVRKKGEHVVITKPHEESPAVKSGLKAGDIILEIDGQSAKGRSADEVNTILKGYPGTEVDLKIKRYGESKPLSISLMREEVQIPNVPYSTNVGQGVGYVSLTTFTRNAGKNVGEALRKLKDEDPGIKGFILDLRHNGGGLLNEAVNVSNLFIPKNELVVTTKGKVIDWDRSFSTMSNPFVEDLPLVVLINSRSASASEIVSGVIQDLDRGVLMGQRSYGKGLVQNTRDIGYNSKLKLTTAKYYIPSGRCIQGVEYENGEPVDIPLDKRTKFKTKGGRTVYDGGGVKPDVILENNSTAHVINNLRRQYMIFDYATMYASKNASIGDTKTFKFNDFEDFVAFVDKNKFQHESRSEDLLRELKSMAEEEDYITGIQTDIKTLEAKIITERNKDLNKYKAEIMQLIQEEIVSRYSYQRGKVINQLENDGEIKEAVKLINDPARYKKILGK